MRGAVLAGALGVLAVLGCSPTTPSDSQAPPTAPPSETREAAAASGTPSQASAPPPTTTTSHPAKSSASPSERPQPPPGTVPPPWLGTRVLPVTQEGFGEVRRTPPALRQRRFTLPDAVAMLPGEGFAARTTAPPPAQVLARSTWQPSCPVAPADLAWVRLTFWGFDERRHTGELLVARSVAADLVRVFRSLYRARFPLEQLRITTPAELDLPPTGDGNNTESFVCRPVTGGTSYSQHAYGLAVDLNPFQNPYLKDRVVLPELASAYLDRTWVRPGMITADGPVVAAFADVGWEWGDAWRTLKDYQHFSLTGR